MGRGGPRGWDSPKNGTLGHGCPGAPGSVPGSVGSGGGRFIVLQQHSTSLANATTIANSGVQGVVAGTLPASIIRSPPSLADGQSACSTLAFQ